MIDPKQWLNTVRGMLPPQRFRYFVGTREQARQTKALLGGPGPHSDDPIVAVNRFCNVDREDDAVTRWIKEHVRHYSPSARHVVPQLLAARVWNHPPTLQRLLPVEDCRAASAVLMTLRSTGEKVMRGAYMMPVHGNNGRGRAVDDYYLAAVSEAQGVDWGTMDTLGEVATRLTQILGIGEFLANQVCADLRYTRWWHRASDWYTFVLCGPGTRRGLDRYVGKTERLGEAAQQAYVDRLLIIREELRATRFSLAPVFDDPNNLANCFCEWDKYERVLQGEVKHLRKYP